MKIMQNTKDYVKSLMDEVNLNPRIRRQLLCCVESGKSFPYVPKPLIPRTSVQPPKHSVMPSTSKLPPRPIQRLKSSIEKFDFYEREQFRPNPSKTRPPNEKQRLQNLMAYGKDIDEELRNMKFEDDVKEECDEPIDMFSEILREIQERQEFLDDMIALGEGKKYLPEIQGQIALRLRELEKIDKRRADVIIQKYGM